MDESKLWYMSANKLFSGLSSQDKDKLASLLSEINVKKKELVYNTGDRAETLYILKKGRIKITRLSEDGKELTVDILEAGDIFGEMTLAGEEERETIAVALEDSLICAIKREDFEDFFSKIPHLSLTMTKWMGLRLRKVENRLENMIFQDVRSRILSILRELAQKYGEPVRAGRKISIRLSHQEIANLIGVSRETVSRELNNLKKNGDILIENKDIILPLRNLFQSHH